MNHRIDDFRSTWKSRTLKLRTCKTIDQHYNVSETVRRIKLRIKDLASITYSLYLIYHRDPQLYGDEMLAFTGDKVIRNFPVYLPFFKSGLIGETGKIPYIEHITPISFFRDLFTLDNLTEKDFIYALEKYYRVAIITTEENDALNRSNFKTTRPVDAYAQVGIRLEGNEVLDEFYKSEYGDLAAR